MVSVFAFLVCSWAGAHSAGSADADPAEADPEAAEPEVAEPEDAEPELADAEPELAEPADADPEAADAEPVGAPEDAPDEPVEPWEAHPARAMLRAADAAMINCRLRRGAMGSPGRGAIACRPGPGRARTAAWMDA